MAVRYSALRMEAVAQVRRVCVSAVSHLLRHCPEATMAKISSVAKYLATFRDHANSATWGSFGTEAVDDGVCPEPIWPSVAAPILPESSDDSSSGSSSESTPSSDDGHKLSAVDTFPWLSPRTGYVHVQRNGSAFMPCCRRIEPKDGCDSGDGFATAALLGRPWCTTCISFVPGLTDKVLAD